MRPGGCLVIDFLNASKVIEGLVTDEVKQINEVSFTISRKVENKRLLKDISVNDEGNISNFHEIVSIFKLTDFIKLFQQTGFELENSFGNYNLEPFDPLVSERLILIARKK